MSFVIREALSAARRPAMQAESHPGVSASVGLVLCILAFSMTQHGYARIANDAVLYAFAALARLYPHSLGHDVYLTVGIQDRFTVFSPLVAPVIRVLGLARAASVITLVSQLGFFTCGWLLARRLMPPSLALVSVALLVMLPSTYGQGHIFTYIEPFMTPRVAAEALVLVGLIAVLGRRILLASLCMAAATTLHPILASAGIAFLFVWYLALPRPKLAIALAIGGFALLAATAVLFPFSPISQFDASWFAFLYQGSHYLFPSRWSFLAWAHACVPFTVLSIGAIRARGGLTRSVCLTAILIGVGGLALSLLGADLLHIVVIAQAQPWRWLWLTNALSVIMTPLVFRECWQEGDASRAAAVLIGAAWICVDEPYVPLMGLLAVLIASSAHRVRQPRQARLLLVGAFAILAFGFVALVQYVLGVGKALSLISPNPTLFSSPYLLDLRKFLPWQAGGIIPACIFLSLWWLATHRRGIRSSFLVLALGVAISGATAQYAWNSWDRWAIAQIPGPLYAKFAPWRHAIPDDAQVLWGQRAFPVWFLLHRASYLSHDQMSAAVFSERLTRELNQRGRAVYSIRKYTQDPRQVVALTCRNSPALGFYVSQVNAGPTPYPSIENPRGAGNLYLYRCADYRE